MIERDGSYTGELIERAKLIKSSKGTYGIELKFNFPEEDDQKLNWVGWLSENAKAKTFETLNNVLESDGSDDVDQDGFFISNKFVNYHKKYTLVVEFEEAIDKEGNTVLNEDGEVKRRPRIKWVNNLGGSTYEGVTPTEAKSILGNLGFKSAIKAGQKKKPATTEQTTQKTPFDNKGNDKLPF